ncbi:unnamed protein product, partial [Mesorhabditis spiculigera]
MEPAVKRVERKFVLAYHPDWCGKFSCERFAKASVLHLFHRNSSKHELEVQRREENGTAFATNSEMRQRKCLVRMITCGALACRIGCALINDTHSPARCSDTKLIQFLPKRAEMSRRKCLVRIETEFTTNLYGTRPSSAIRMSISKRNERSSRSLCIFE